MVFSFHVVCYMYVGLQSIIFSLKSKYFYTKFSKLIFHLNFFIDIDVHCKFFLSLDPLFSLFEEHKIGFFK